MPMNLSPSWRSLRKRRSTPERRSRGLRSSKSAANPSAKLGYLFSISYRGGDVEGASEDHDSSTDEDGHGINGILTPRRVAATTFKNQRRKKRSWRMQNQGARSKSKGGKIKKAGGKAKQAGRLNPQAAPANFTVATQQCQCGAINCDGCEFVICACNVPLAETVLSPRSPDMFQYSDASEGAADV